MKVLITGGAGFIGTALARRLANEDHDVHIIDNLSPQIHGDLPRVTGLESVRFQRCDVQDLMHSHELVEGCDAIFHLAAETGTAQSMYQIQHYVSVNDLGTASLLEAIAKCERRPKRVILASSRSVYGEGAYVHPDMPTILIQPTSRTREQLLNGDWDFKDNNGQCLKAIPTPETLLFAPGSIYAATKASQELLLQSAGHALGFAPIILRFQNVYGEGQSLMNPYTGIISIFFNRARQGLEIPIYEDGLESRDFIHIDDIVDGLVTSMTADVPYGATINLGAGTPVSVVELAKQLIASSGHDVPVRITGQFRLGDIRHCYADLSIAQELLGFIPRISLADGLTRFCNWASGQPVHEDGLEKAALELRTRNLMA